jgi:murein DD-endopeptidase MepM/ murein hydrolase activator NlpD
MTTHKRIPVLLLCSALVPLTVSCVGTPRTSTVRFERSREALAQGVSTSLDTNGSAKPPLPYEEMVLEGTAQQGHVLYGRAPPSIRAIALDGADVPIAADRRFLLAFDRDAGRSATLRLTLADGRVIDRHIPVLPGNWRIERINASPTAGLPSEEFRRRRAGELAQIEAARSAMRPESSEGWRQSFVWPVVARISGAFGAQRIYRGTPGSYHTGVDIAARSGTVYVAPADGVVILAAQAPFTLEGNLLIIDHGMGLNSAFLHSERLLVKPGEVVRRGQPIGVVGATGRVTGPHLHWGLKWNGARIDPVSLVKDAALEDR